MNFLVTVQRTVKLAAGRTRPNGCEVLDECGDRGYDFEPHREWLRQLGIEPLLPHATRHTRAALASCARWHGSISSVACAFVTNGATICTKSS